VTRGGSETARVIPGRHVVSVGLPEKVPPHGWTWRRLTDIAQLETGHTPSKSMPEYWDGDIPWLGIKDARVCHGEIIWDTSRHITAGGLENSSARLLPKGTVCLSRTASVGYVTILGVPMATSQDFVNWICGESLDPKFLMLALLAEGKDLLRFGKGSTHTTIYFPEVRAFYLCLPSLAEQARIVASVEHIRAFCLRVREALDGIYDLIERFREAVLEAAFCGNLTAGWRGTNPQLEPADSILTRIETERRRLWRGSEAAKVVGGVFEDNRRKSRREEPEPIDYPNLPSLPEGWLWSSLASVQASEPNSLIDGPFGSRLKTEDYVDSGARVIRLGNVGVGEFIESDRAFISQAKFESLYRHAVFPGDLVIAALAEPVGRAMILPSDIGPAIVKADCVRLKVHSAILSRYVMHALNSPGGRLHAEAAAHGVGRLRINMGDMRRLPLPVAPRAEQEEIVREIDAAFLCLKALGNWIEEIKRDLDLLERSILAKAFRGELVR